MLKQNVQLQAILESAVDGFVTITEQGIVETFNPASERLFGYRPEEVIGKNVTMLMPMPYSPNHGKYLENYLETGIKKVIGIGREVVGRCKDGSTFPMELSVSEFMDGTRRMFTGVVCDITKRKVAEQVLKDSLVRIGAVLNTAADGIITIDSKGMVDSYNPASEKIFGYSAKEVLGKNINMLMPEPFRSEHTGYLQAYLKTGTRRVIGIGREVLGRRKDGLIFPIELSVSEFHLGEETMFTGMVRDITERKRAEAAMEARDAAEESNRLKSEFLANMTHELRTPLNAVLGYSELLQEDAKDMGLDTFIPDLEKINAAGQHLLSLVNHVLDLSKIESGKMDVFLEELSIGVLVSSISGTLQPLAEKNGNTLKVKCPEDIGDMFTDATKLRQVLLNLVGNAVKFTQNGQITVTVGKDRVEEHAWIVFSVKDTGIGIESHQIGHLFQEFLQADSSTTRKYGGTGLGLAISKKYCELLGGTITVKSKLGVGSIFEVHLPADLRDSLPGETESETDFSPILPSGVLESERLVLVVDDDPKVLEMMRRTLEREGFQVATMSRGESVVQTVKQLRPRVITLDVRIPDMDGWSVLQELQEDPETFDIPVLMCTIVDEKARGLMLGASEYLVKPIDHRRLIEIVKGYVHAAAGVALIVDDDEMTRMVMHRTLKNAGWQVHEAKNGVDGLHQVKKNKPDLILLDLMMPEMDGFGFVTGIRKKKEWRKIPIVVVTAKEITAQDRRRLNGSIRALLAKENGTGANLMEELREVLRRALQEKAPTILGDDFDEQNFAG